jgi:3-isopropylmalate dehydrogenase
VALLLRYSLVMPEEAILVEKAVAEVLKEGFRTQDIYSEGNKLVGTAEMGNQTVKKLEQLLNQT